jgi:ubiquinone/menaquinone biosynthesis C-methylase UbiE
MDAWTSRRDSLDGSSEKIITPDPASPDEQRRITEYFDSIASYWDEIYQRRDVFSVIHQLRLVSILAWVDELVLPPDARLLEVGCGAGPLTVALAQRGYAVTAMDSVKAMIDLTRRHAEQAGVLSRVTLSLGDVHRLAFPDKFADLVLAIGVIPWLRAPETAIQELARVLRPGGHLVISADNRWRLHFLVDPAKNPYLAPARRAVRHVIKRKSQRKEAENALLHSVRAFDRMVAAAGLEKVQSKTLGFGPFSFLGREFAGSWQLRLHWLLQGWADRGFPLIRLMGGQCLILARKPDLGENKAKASTAGLMVV